MNSADWEERLRLAPLRLWVRNRPVDCPARRCVEALLVQAVGPVRVGVCSLSGGPVSAGGVRCVGVSVSQVEWPVVCSGLDVVVVVHAGELGARVKARMLAGPMLFVRCGGVDEVPGLVAGLLGSGELVESRRRVLGGGLAAVAARFPGVSVPLLESVPAAAPSRNNPSKTSDHPQVAVIGPDAGVCERVSGLLAGRWVVAESPSPSVDVVVAVAPARGWASSDVVTLSDAFSRVGRLVSVGELPVGVPPGVRVCGVVDVDAVVAEVLGAPPRGVLPDPDGARWLQAAERADCRARERLRGELLGADAWPTDRLVRLCQWWEVEVPRRFPLRSLIDVPLVAVGAAVAVFRLGVPVPGVLGFGVVCGGVRLWSHWWSSRRRWCSLVISRLAHAAELDSTSYRQRGVSVGGQWVRLRLAGLEKQQK